jgi:hypothetical protein
MLIKMPSTKSALDFMLKCFRTRRLVTLAAARPVNNVIGSEKRDGKEVA